MKNALLFLGLGALLFLSGCSGPSDKEVGQAVLLVTPTVFLISLGFQYLFFRLWKLIYPQLTLAWLPNFIFYLFLLIVAGLLGNGNPFWFLGDDQGLAGLVLLIFGPSFLTILFIVMRVWLSVNPSRVFTWVTILVMSFYLLLALPLATGLAEGSSFSEMVIRFWMFPGTFPFGGNDFGWPGVPTALVFLILLVEVLIRIRRMRKTQEPPAG